MCENQVKQCAFSDHRKSIKKLFFGEKITGDDTQRQKVWLKQILQQKIFHTTISDVSL